MLIINRVTLIKGDSKESINKGPIALEIMNVEQFREHVKLLFKCDRVLLDYTEEDETENKDWCRDGWSLSRTGAGRG